MNWQTTTLTWIISTAWTYLILIQRQKAPSQLHLTIILWETPQTSRCPQSVQLLHQHVIVVSNRSNRLCQAPTPVNDLNYEEDLVDANEVPSLHTEEVSYNVILSETVVQTSMAFGSSIVQ